MKKRLLSLVLAASMLLGSVNVAFADGNSVPVDTVEAAIDDVVAVADNVESGAPTDPAPETKGPVWETTDPWKATVFGDVGGQGRIDAYGDLSNPEGYPHGDGVYIYGVEENGDEVNVRMGIPNEDPTQKGEPQGKIAGSSEGIVYYYREISADEDYTLSATAHIDGIWNDNNQVSFGATVRDTVLPLQTSAEAKLGGDSISAAVLHLDKFGDDRLDPPKKGMQGSYFRKGGTLKEFPSIADAVPTKGDDIDISITKSGSMYTLKFGNDITLINAEEEGISLTDDVYVGFFASRCADITFKNVNYSKSGTVELGDWLVSGNGANGKSASAGNLKSEVSEDASTIKMETLSATAGKLSASEDSYFYTAVQAPGNEGFKVTSNMKINVGKTEDKNQDQKGAGFIVFDHRYVKDEDVEGTVRGSDGNSLFVGIMPKSKTDAGYRLVARVKKGTAEVTPIIEEDLGNLGEDAQIDLSVTRNGDNVKVIANGVSKDINIKDLFTENQYIGYMVARDAKIEVTNNNVTVGTRKIKSAEVLTPPEKDEYYTTQKFDTTGLSFKVVYEDGEEVIIDNPNDYSLTGFDDMATQSFNTVGEKIVKAIIGSAIVDIPITVRKIKVISMNVDYAPIYDTFYNGGKFNFTGLQVTANFEDGTSKKLTSEEYELYIADTLIVPNVTTITDEMVSPDVAITVKYTGNDDSIDPSDAEAAFYVAIDPGKLTGLRIGAKGYKTIFYVGQEYDQSGLTVMGVYTDSNNIEKTQLISSDLYTVVGFDSSVPNDSLQLKIQYNENPSIYTTLEVKILPVSYLYPNIVRHPRYTFSVNEVFDAKGLELAVYKSDLNIESTNEEYYFYKNGTEYYKVKNGESVDKKSSITEAELLGADYYIDLSNYDSSTAGTETQVYVYLNAKYGMAASSPVQWDISIVESTDYVWKAMLFGASVGGSSMSVNYTNNKTESLSGGESNIKPSLMENNKLSNIDSIRLVSMNKSGKITGDHDGIAYYYTMVNGQNNFIMSADVTVNAYTIDLDNLSADEKKSYEGYLAQGLSSEEAINRMRNGQEGFGIMARDVLPLTGTYIDGEYTGDANDITTLASDSLRKNYTFTKADGTEVTYNYPVDVYESGGKYGSDAPSNIVLAGGFSGSTFPKDPAASSYWRNANLNRINIWARYNSTKIGNYSTTNDVPMKGDKYHITLTKLNTGFAITTYDYQEGTTNTQYIYDDVENTKSILNTKDPDNIYVGVFAARLADITVENIELYETQTSTDPNLTGKVTTAKAPNITVSSPLYTNSVNYDLKIKSNATKGVMGGLTSISLNGKNVVSDMTVGSKEVVIDTVLKPSSVNNFSIVYYPNTADDFTSYDPVITRFTVTHKSSKDLNDMDKIYVAPNGSLSGDGSRNNPLTLEMALGIVEPGGQVIMLDGTYNLTNEYAGKITISEADSGYHNGYFKSLVADEGANPVIDLQKKFAGFEVAASYWYFKGFTVKNSRDNSGGFYIGGNHNVVEDCTFAYNGDTGLQISRLASDKNVKYEWPSYNLIKSCESYMNCDPSQNNADGFAAKLTVGYGNVFEDCISHHNVDDGWDLYTKLESGDIGPVVIQNCIAYKNGYQLNEETGEEKVFSSPEGNGFKLGGESIYVEHYLKDCISFGNYNSGVTTNNNPALIIRDVVSYKNDGSNFGLHSGSTAVLTDAAGNKADEKGRPYKFNYDIKGAVSYGSSDGIGAWNKDTAFGNISVNPVDSETNYLANTGSVGKNSLGESVDPAKFFVSTNVKDALGNNNRYSRAEDGSFIRNGFLERTAEYAYEHDVADLVTFPDVYGNKGGIGLDVTTSETTTETTTKAVVYKPSSGAGGGGSVKNYVATTEEVTEETTEEATEATTETVKFTDSVSVKIGDTNILVNDESFAMDVAPYIQASSNSTMVPLRFVSIALAGESVDAADSSNLITWDAVTKTATIKSGADTIVFTAGSKTYMVNGNTLNISNQAVAEIVDGRMFVPFRTIGTALGAEVSWDANTKTAMYN